MSVVGFGRVPKDVSPDTIAYTCVYSYQTTGNPEEADVIISNEIDWALTADDCVFETLLEPTLTHEVGHIYGLDHVSERAHPDLTMSTTINGPCENDESSLGLGDVLGLEELYGRQ